MKHIYELNHDQMDYFNGFNFQCLCAGTRLNKVTCSKTNRGLYRGQLGPLPADTITSIL